jgi:hypothetical protein
LSGKNFDCLKIDFYLKKLIKNHFFEKWFFVCKKVVFFRALAKNPADLDLEKWQKIWNASRICVSSLRRGHANLLCIVPILVYVHLE